MRGRGRVSKKGLELADRVRRRDGRTDIKRSSLSPKRIDALDRKPCVHVHPGHVFLIPSTDVRNTHIRRRRRRRRMHSHVLTYTYIYIYLYMFIHIYNTIQIALHIHVRERHIHGNRIYYIHIQIHTRYTHTRRLIKD